MTDDDGLGNTATIDNLPMQAGSADSRSVGESRRAYPRIIGHIARAVGLVGLWRERAWGRRRLAMLPDHLLKDIGVTGVEAEREIGKPFWRG